MEDIVHIYDWLSFALDETKHKLLNDAIGLGHLWLNSSTSSTSPSGSLVESIYFGFPVTDKAGDD